MSTPYVPAPAKAVLSILSSQWDLFWPQLRSDLENKLSGIDYLSEHIPFIQTHYYDVELGTPITRRIVGFERLLPMQELALIKMWTNSLEQQWADKKAHRLFNLDPGYITLERLVLATGKNFTHRIYLDQGIWADLTLIFQHGQWTDLPWTFPDYATPEIKAHLNNLRTQYKNQLHAATQAKETYKNA
ncbi:MAG: DUF4416 family protein [Desulfoplanes sp.]|jgi:hypothetical protein|nr:DUF4416 family protein [Desulfoplanes sp.]